MSIETNGGNQKSFWQKHALRRYPGIEGKRVRKLATTSSRLADLALSFPALLYAIAMKSEDSHQRLIAISMIEQGSPLPVVAEHLGIPMWMRRLPPDAFGHPLPRKLPDSAAFSRRIVNHIPVRPKQTNVWLDWILSTTLACDENFALWLASRELYASPSLEKDPFIPLALWAWYSQRPDSLAHSYIDDAWHPKIGFRRAVEKAGDWLKRLKLILYCSEQPIALGWLAADEINGYSFMPLLTAEQHISEAIQMRNCADQFVDALRSGTSRLYQVRKNGQQVATMELRAHPEVRYMPTINQLRIRRNRHAWPELWRAAYLYVGQGELLPAPPQEDVRLTIDKDLWYRLWSPYWMVKGISEQLPEIPDECVFFHFDSAIAGLELKADEKDWSLE